jgi:mono/diheme cytochrome c family protein
VSRLLRVVALMLLGVAVWESLPAHAQYQGYGASQVKVPLYGAYYSGGDPPAGAPQDDRLARIEKTLEGVAAQVAYVAAYVKRAEELEKQQAEPARGQGDPVVGQVMQVCAKCHRSDAADKVGGGFAMFDKEGRFSASSARELRRMVSRINSPDAGFVMPPPKAGALTPAQKKAFTDLALADIASQEKK